MKTEETTGYAKIIRPDIPQPLYRQEQVWARQGAALKRAMMVNWVIQTSDLYLKPFSDAFLRR